MKKNVDQEFKILYELSKTLANISNTVMSFKDMMSDIIDMFGKQGTDISLLNQKIDFMKEQIKDIEGCIKEFNTKITQLTIQTDFKEKIDFKSTQAEIKKAKDELTKQEIKLKKENKSKILDKLWSILTELIKNSKWVAIILFILLAVSAGLKWTDILMAIFK